jgi:hypothetical protein
MTYKYTKYPNPNKNTKIWDYTYLKMLGEMSHQYMHAYPDWDPLVNPLSIITLQGAVSSVMRK